MLLGRIRQPIGSMSLPILPRTNKTKILGHLHEPRYLAGSREATDALTDALSTIARAYLLSYIAGSGRAEQTNTKCPHSAYIIHCRPGSVRKQSPSKN